MLSIQEMILQMKSEDHKKRDTTENEERVNAKLPKLIITKFDGTSLGQLRFWNKFETEIDKVEIVPVSKFLLERAFNPESEIAY